MTTLGLGRVKGIEIRLDFSWFIVFILFSWTLAAYYFPYHYPHWSPGLNWGMGILACLLLFVSVLLHELAHSLVAQRRGEEVKSITLFILGGVAQISKDPATPYAEFTMAIAGPLASFILGVIFLGLKLWLTPFSEALGALTTYLVYVNFILAVFNLLPGYPMDGGRVLKAVLWKITGNLKRATQLATKVGTGIAFFFIFFGLFQVLAGLWLNGLWIIFIGWFLHQASSQSYQQVLLKDFLRGIKAKDIMSQDFAIVPPQTSLKTLTDEYILKKGQRAFFVGNKDNILGIICLDDVKKVPPQNQEATFVKDIMTPKIALKTVSPEDDAMEVLHRLSTLNVHQIPVVINNDHILGIITRQDFLRWLQVRTEWER
jgi:Zn-dependent protease/predicted transcriptional regulator